MESMRFSESRATTSLDRRKGYARVNEERLRHAPALSDFAHLCPDTEKDIAKCTRLREKYAEKLSKEERGVQGIHMLAKALEAVIFSEGEKSNWFGESAITIYSSEYDDLCNDIDLIIEFTDAEGKKFHVAVDVTTAEDLREKMEEIETGMEQGTLGTAKYFASGDGELQVQKTGMPKIILGVDKSIAQELMDLWLNNDRKALAAHPAQVELLDEMHMQFKRFKEVAEQWRQPELARVYTTALNIATDIRRSKLQSMEVDRDKFEQDPVYYSLKESLKTFGGALAA